MPHPPAPPLPAPDLQSLQFVGPPFDQSPSADPALDDIACTR